MTAAAQAPESPAPGRTTVDEGEIARFSAIAAEWWDPRGKFRPLHKFNPVRLAYLRDTICAHLGRDPMAPQPLRTVGPAGCDRGRR